MRSSAEAIDSLLKQIVDIAHPLRVVLFGSAARGDAGAGSDIDMLIVIPDGHSRREVARRLYGSIRGVRVPFDLVIATPALLKRHEHDCGMVYRHALLEGRELYAA